jgi:hypothetical protein
MPFDPDGTHLELIEPKGPFTRSSQDQYLSNMNQALDAAFEKCLQALKSLA